MPSLVAATPIQLVAQEPRVADTPGSGVIVVSVTDVGPAQQADDLQLSVNNPAAVQPSGYPKVDFERPAALPSTTAARQWAIPFVVHGMAPATTLTLHVTVTVAGRTWTLPFQATSPAAPAAATWSMKAWPPNGRTYEPGQRLPVTVSVSGGTPLAELRVASFDLIEQSTRKTARSPGWVLCPAEPVACTEGTKALPSGVHKLQLAPALPPSTQAGALMLDPGKYDAMLVLTGSTKAEGNADTLTTTLYVTTIGHKWAGIGALLLGFMLSVAITTLTRRWIDRNRLMTPAAVVQQTVMRLQQDLSGIENRPAPEPIDGRLRDILTRLQPAALEHAGMPRKVPSPWNATSDADLERLKKHVELLATEVRNLQAIFEGGMLRIERLAQSHCDEPRMRAYRELNELALSLPPDAAMLKSSIDAIVDEFRGACSSTEKSGIQSTESAAQSYALPTLEQLQIRIQQGNLLVWLFVCFVAVAVGTYLLVLSNPGFGTSNDLLNCLLWGLGVSTAAGAAGVTLGSVISTFNVLR